MIVNIIIIAVIAGVFIYAISGSVKHLKGEGSCCNAGSIPKGHKIKVPKIEDPLGEKRVVIEGMSCKHCKVNVENSLNSLGHINAKVDLSKGQAIVQYDKEVSDEDIKNAVEHAGYKVVVIDSKTA